MACAGCLFLYKGRFLKMEEAHDCFSVLKWLAQI